ncbi:hypothetical protein MMH89_03900 [Candidatus Comchoanobacter bicostacola]|uniref:Uncharacterized protein n=1 Tax=Candidatus Comchoanobacter bicostacola TaxID=2919598 RepID=A0ABY5DI88_9GAMM|nr:hypothetical protein [Candidatus Comchoanobacter bicostacola]UTC24361.1 hypothetical protein MMH89_03900 [Candidatus Comchoanobacter bicostacola]
MNGVEFTNHSAALPHKYLFKGLSVAFRAWVSDYLALTAGNQSFYFMAPSLVGLRPFRHVYEPHLAWYRGWQYRRQSVLQASKETVVIFFPCFWCDNVQELISQVASVPSVKQIIVIDARCFMSPALGAMRIEQVGGVFQGFLNGWAGVFAQHNLHSSAPAWMVRYSKDPNLWVGHLVRQANQSSVLESQFVNFNHDK